MRSRIGPALLWVACISRVDGPGQFPPTRARDAEYVPLEPGVEAYGHSNHTTVPTRLAELAAVASAAAQQLGIGPPVWDGRLAGVAADLAHALSEEGTPPIELVDFLASHHGLTEPSPYLLVASTQGPLDGLIDEVRERLRSVLVEMPRVNRMGAAEARTRSDETRLVVAFSESYVELQPIRRRVETATPIIVRGRLLPPFVKVELFVTRPDGRARPVAAEPHQGPGSFHAQVHCDAGPGRYQIELTSEDRHGAAVMANFPVWCAEEPPRNVLVPPQRAPVTTAQQAERAIAELINSERRRAGLGPLEFDESLAAVARDHSKDMSIVGFVGHLSPTTGSPADRVRRAGLRPNLLLENVARTYSPEEAQAGLMGSPGHRRNVLNPEVTRIGVGVILGRSVANRRELWVTELFAAME